MNKKNIYPQLHKQTHTCNENDSSYLEVDANDLGALELPGEASHHVDSVSTANTDAQTAEAAFNYIPGIKVNA